MTWTGLLGQPMTVDALYESRPKCAIASTGIKDADGMNA